jgi:hypothetical protein
MALEATEAVPAPMAVEAQWMPPAPNDHPDTIVSAVTSLLEVLPDVDFDFDFDFDFDVDSDDHDNAQSASQSQSQSQSSTQSQSANAPSQSQDTAVTDETRRRVADALITALNDENEDVREQALNALASMRDPRAIPGLLRAMRDTSAGARSNRGHPCSAEGPEPRCTGACGAARGGTRVSRPAQRSEVRRVRHRSPQGRGR